MDVIDNTTLAIALGSFISFARILSRQWWTLFQMQIVNQEKAVTVVRGLCVLRNFLKTVQDPITCHLAIPRNQQPMATL